MNKKANCRRRHLGRYIFPAALVTLRKTRCVGQQCGAHLCGLGGASFLEVKSSTILEAVNNNTLGALRMIQQALPAMNRNGYGRIVNVSTGMAALTDMGGGSVPYRMSKTALNAVTRIALAEARRNVKINAVCPGWVKTDMGGPSAPRDLGQGAAGIVWAATLADDGPSGHFFRGGKEVAW